MTTRPPKSLLLRQLAFGLAAGVLGAAANRMGVWTFGCDLACPGCGSEQTWGESSLSDAHWVPLDTLLRLAAERDPGGLVISGGEPTQQHETSTALARGFKSLFPQREVVLYSGLRFAPLLARFPALVAAVDVVVSGPYVQTLPANPLAGSANQEVHILSPLAEELFKDWPTWPAHRLQVASQIAAGGDTEIVTVGIPHTKRLAQAAERLARPVQKMSFHPPAKRTP